MQKLIIITGPTAIGKTKLSISLAKKINGEIISADSMQIYKGMDIGSAKATEEEKEGITHHLIDVVNPDEEFTVSDFKKIAENKIKEVEDKGKYPIIIGGTGLYLNSIIYQYDFSLANKDDDYRSYLYNLAKEKGNFYIHELLREKDVESYKKLHPNNVKRVIRALEIHKLTGAPVSSFDEDNPPKIPYDLKYFVLTMDRDILYERINERVDSMIKRGLIDEVKNLRDKGFTKDMQSMKGIGYKEILSYLDGEISLEYAIELIKKGSRNYAKRQLTWFRKEKNAIWIDKDEFKGDEEILDYMLSLL